MRPRFAIDANVGRLAKWLRGMGYDALYLPDVEDAALLELAQSENRIVLTRDRYILERRLVARGQVRALLVKSHDLRQQLREVAEAFGLDSKNEFSLCLRCNTPLEAIAKQAVNGRVPEYVFRTQEHFYECPRCRKLYWRGTHWQNMREELAAFPG